MNQDWDIVLTTPESVAQEHPNILSEMANLDHAAVVIRDFYSPRYCEEVVQLSLIHISEPTRPY